MPFFCLADFESVDDLLCNFRWPVWRTLFVLSMVKVLLMFGLVLPAPSPVLLTLLTGVGFCLGEGQSLTLHVAFSKVPNPSKKLLLAVSAPGSMPNL